MDLQMPGMSGVDAIIAIRAEHSDARIIVLTTYTGDAQAVRALKAGAAGYLLKSSLRTELIDAIRDVHRGHRHVTRDVADEIAAHVVDETLSEREIAILRLVAIGKANKQVASELGLSEETIKGHMKNIFAKLGVADRTHAVTLAARHYRVVSKGFADLLPARTGAYRPVSVSGDGPLSGSLTQSQQASCRHQVVGGSPFEVST